MLAKYPVLRPGVQVGHPQFGSSFIKEFYHQEVATSHEPSQPLHDPGKTRGDGPEYDGQNKHVSFEIADVHLQITAISGEIPRVFVNRMLFEIFS